ncbi:hypothetical protein FD754_021700, partial [Muntiacus muntjak]
PWKVSAKKPQLACFCLFLRHALVAQLVKNLPAMQETRVRSMDEETSSAPIQRENGDRGSSEDLCYTLINHSLLGRRPSGISAEESYENVSPKAERPGAPLRGTETEYSLLRVPSAPKHPSSPEDEYELLMPGGAFPHSLRQPRPLAPHPQAPFSHL